MSNEEQIMQRYLLGEMTEAERAALEQKYFNNPQMFDRVVQVENELVDMYARGLLPPLTRERFERHYLAHPKRRERAQFAGALAAKLEQPDEVAAALPPHAESLWGRLLSSMRVPKLAWAFSAALLLVAAGAAWFFLETMRPQQELAKTETERATQEPRERESPQQVADERQPSERPPDERERTRTGQQNVTPSPTQGRRLRQRSLP
jgi:anti-sigma factor RsiW